MTVHRVGRRSAAVAVSLGLACALAGCGADPGQDAQAPAEPALTGGVERVTDADQIHLPVDAFTVSAAQATTLREAFTGAVQACAARFGVETDIPAPQNPTAAELNARRYGIVDAAAASRSGYTAADPTAGQDGERDWEPSPLEAAVLSGDGSVPTRDRTGAPPPDGGCLGEVQARLGGPPPVDPGQWSTGSFAAAEQDSRVEAAQAAWSECMSAAGHDFQNSWEPNDRDWPTPTTQEERRTAADDVACRERTNLVGIWMAVEGAYQQRAMAEQSEEVDRLRTWFEGHVAAAEELVGAP